MGFNFIREDAAKYLGISLTPSGKVRKKDIPTVNAWLDNGTISIHLKNIQNVVSTILLLMDIALNLMLLSN